MRARILATLEALEREGHLSPEQRSLVQERIEGALGPRDHTGRFITILGSFGAVLIAAGFLYLVGYHWDGFEKATKLALVFGIWAGFFAASYLLGERPGHYPKLGQAFLLAGVLGFGAAIGLVAQIYNLSAHYPWSLCLWWALNVPLLLWTRSRSVQFVVSALFLVWVFWHQGVWMDDHPGAHEEIAIIGVLCAGLATFFAALAALARSARMPDLQRFAAPWSMIAIFGVLLGPYLAGFRNSFRRTGHELVPPALALPACALALTGVLVGLCALARGRTRGELMSVLACLATFVLLGVFTLWAPDTVAVAGNLLTLATILYLVYAGSTRGRLAWINAGLAAFFVWVVTRYFEYLWSKLEGAYAFLVTGVLLMLLGWFLERRRKRWTARAKAVNA